MEQSKSSISKEKERVRINQEIINCDNNIVKCYLAQDVILLEEWKLKRMEFEFLLYLLEPPML